MAHITREVAHYVSRRRLSNSSRRGPPTIRPPPDSAPVPNAWSDGVRRRDSSSAQVRRMDAVRVGWVAPTVAVWM